MSFWLSVSNPLRARADRLRERFQSWSLESIAIAASSGGADSAKLGDDTAPGGSIDREAPDRPGVPPASSSRAERPARTAESAGKGDAEETPATNADPARPEGRRSREKRRGRRKILPEPPTARFVMVAPGRYVRVEEPQPAVADPLSTAIEAGDQAASPPPDSTPDDPAGGDRGDDSVDAGQDRSDDDEDGGPEALEPPGTTGPSE
jgi:hypothetical protein